MTPMPWDEYLRFLLKVEECNVEENYRIGRAANDADEEMYKATREGFAALQAMMPVILAAPDLLAALKFAANVMQHHEIDEWLAGEFAIITDAIAKAEGRGA